METEAQVVSDLDLGESHSCQVKESKVKDLIWLMPVILATHEAAIRKIAV
jgi:hypothetical protein